MSLLVTLVAGIVFGLALAAPPGPMNAVIAEESVLHGWFAGARAGLGAATADAVFFVLAYVGVVAVVNAYPMLHASMLAAGGVLMCYFAYGAARGARASFRPTSGTGESMVGGKGFRKAFALALTNPFQVVFWLTVGVGMLKPGALDVLVWLPVVGDSLAGEFVVATGSSALIGGFFAGIGIWVLGFPAVLVVAERRVERLTPIVAGGSALVLAGFGVFFLSDAAISFYELAVVSVGTAFVVV